MEWVETTGKSVEDAKELALDQLGVDESDAEFEVLSDVKTGLFGRVKADARVRARVRPAVPRSKDANNRRKRRPERDDKRDDKKASGSGRPPRATEERPAESRSSNEARPAKPPRPRNPNPARRPKSAPQNEGASPMEDEVPLNEQGQLAKDFLAGLFSELDAGATISVDVRDEDNVVMVAVEGENMGHLIGPRGATLQALQEITRTVVQRKTGARNGRIIVDVSQYREKRREALERFTRQIAEEVISTNSQRVLESMNPADRKTVHDVANTISGVETTSEGEEPRRYVVIKPSSAS